MTQALCLNCGGYKTGVLVDCPACAAQPTGNALLDILFSDHRLTQQTLDEIAQLVKTIHPACLTEAERFWVLMKYMTVNFPGLVLVELPENQRDRVDKLLVWLKLPKIKIEISEQFRHDMAGGREDRKWWEFWK